MWVMVKKSNELRALPLSYLRIRAEDGIRTHNHVLGMQRSEIPSKDHTFGSGGGTRTHIKPLNRRLLIQLSYPGMLAGRTGLEPAIS